MSACERGFDPMTLKAQAADGEDLHTLVLAWLIGRPDGDDIADAAAAEAKRQRARGTQRSAALAALFEQVAREADIDLTPARRRGRRCRLV